MLILVRKPGQAFAISGGITVTVLEVGRDRVKLGIDAPPAVRVLREELIEGALNEALSAEPAHSGSAQARDQLVALARTLCTDAVEARLLAQHARWRARETRRTLLKVAPHPSHTAFAVAA